MDQKAITESKDSLILITGATGNIGRLIEDYAHYRRGEASAIASGVQDATGVAPHTFDDFACDYAPAFS